MASKADLQAAQDSYDIAVANYNNQAAAVTCYAGSLPTIAEAISGSLWPNKASCTTKGSCNQKDKDNCQNMVGDLQVMATALQSAKQNLDTVTLAYNNSVKNSATSGGVAKKVFVIVLVIVVVSAVIYWAWKKGYIKSIGK